MEELAGRVRVLSDLHLGHDICTIARVSELEPLLDGAQTVIFNGDTYEAKAARFAAKGADMLGELKALCQRCGARMLFLNGNHDPACWESDWLEREGVFITHGHVLLRHISPWSTQMRWCRDKIEAIWSEYSPADLEKLDVRFEITRRCCEVLRVSETRQHGRGLAASISLFAREIWPPRRPMAILKVWMDLPNLGFGFLDQFRPRNSVLLIGHTHRAKVWKRGERWLVNTGGFVTFANSFVADFAEGHLIIRKIRLMRGGFHPAGEVVRIALPVPPTV